LSFGGSFSAGQASACLLRPQNAMRLRASMEAAARRQECLRH